MTPAEVLSYFGSQTAIALALGRGQSTVSEWFKAGSIPDGAQYQIEIATDSALKADKPALRFRKECACTPNDNTKAKTTQSQSSNLSEAPTPSVGGAE